MKKKTGVTLTQRSVGNVADCAERLEVVAAQG
jgi:hypothetical protein